MKASILGSILFVTLATAGPMMESNPSPNGAAMDMSMKRGMGMDMKNMPSADMNMKHGMRMNKMPSGNGNEPMDMNMDMKRDMEMKGMPSTRGNNPMGMNMPMEGKGQLPGMDMGMPTEGRMDDTSEGMSDAESMPSIDMGLDMGMGEGMGMGEDDEGMMD
ncbi:hypothetical protein BJX96DRAFT_173730 [Aspergillus floccosus]